MWGRDFSFFFSSRRRHTRYWRDWSSDVCSSDLQKVVSWFVMRWQLEVTFQEARRHLGFETQRQWSDMAIRRTTPALLGLFSVITLFAQRQMKRAAGALRRQVAWYHKRDPTFADGARDGTQRV